MNKQLHLGIDVGSSSAKVVVMDSHKDIVEEIYTQIEGQPLQTVALVLKDLLTRISASYIKSVSVTGSGGKLISELIGGRFVNEIIAQSKAIEYFYPQVRTIIEIGGEDSKLILLSQDKQGHIKIEDFAMNTLCAAGTGSFLDQQASRLGLTIEEFGTLALKSQTPPRIAGRCSVFAKSDMIHLQQEATPVSDIVAGLCYALARNLKSNIGKGKKIVRPVSFQGGVAANHGVRRALSDVLKLGKDGLIIPRYYLTMGAIGAILMAMEEGYTCNFLRIENLVRYIQGEKPKIHHLHPLVLTSRKAGSQNHTFVYSGEKIDCYLGVDVGSISTNVVLINKDGDLVAKCYLMTQGKPLEAVKQGLRMIEGQVGDTVNILGAGTTGSGRYLTADFIGADIVKNEITAQAAAAASIDPKVDTVFEIGGQDSKYILLENGAVVDFQMNKVCAAGTGSFLEEQAESLGISIKEEFGNLALSSKNPVPLGERCTVFMKSDLVHHQQRGTPKADLIAGLCYAIAQNYLNKVVGDKRIGEHILFQGGVASNLGVVAAFEEILGKKVKVPHHHDVTGAIGVALLAMRERNWNKSRFKGFCLSKVGYNIKTFECKSCPNRCEIKRVSMEGEKSLFYGGRCEKYERKRGLSESNLPDLFEERDDLLLSFAKVGKNRDSHRGRIGIPRALHFHDILPFWGTFFTELGFEVVLSDPTNKQIIRQGIEKIVVETCFPVKVAHGHVLNLLEKGIDKIFLPSTITMACGYHSSKSTTVCPYVQTIPYTVQSSIHFEDYNIELLRPIIYLGRRKRLEQELLKLGRKLGIGPKKIYEALDAAIFAQKGFEECLQKRGEEVLSGLKMDEKAIVIVSRPYNGYDPGMNLRLPQKLRELGMLAIPSDFLSLDKAGDMEDMEKMYWSYGQRILSAARIIKDDLRLYAVYITNFACGPDSFIIHFFKDALRGKPYLEIEIDEHSADAGMVTRLEAYLDSLKNFHAHKVFAKEVGKVPFNIVKGHKRTVYIPNMADHAYAVAAAFEACGVEACVLPESDEETLDWGRHLTTGKECYPCILTTGDMVKWIRSPGFNPEKSAFFMPSGEGPCRFGQYHRFQRMVLDSLGYKDLPIYSPNQDNGGLYRELGMIANDFTRLAWQGIVAVDLLEKSLREISPYEKIPDEARKVYDYYIKKVCRTIMDRGDLLKVLSAARYCFEDIPLNGRDVKPIVGIVGEIYIRCNKFANEDVIGHIEGLGGEVWLPPFSEWILYTNFMAKRKFLNLGEYRQYMKLLLEEHVQKKDERRMTRTFHGALKNLKEPSVNEILKNARPYLHDSFEGEAILSVGKIVDFVRKGVSGVINVMPFTCMPGTIVHAIVKRYRERDCNIPFLNIAYDGQKQTNIRTRLEAFMYQVNQYWKDRGNDGVAK
ncbi:MAG TPA: CoA activase [Syntrophaceae bacterium]|nr:CoA activase [Syntrophaceae bacterium]